VSEGVCAPEHSAEAHEVRPSKKRGQRTGDEAVFVSAMWEAVREEGLAGQALGTALEGEGEGGY